MEVVISGIQQIGIGVQNVQEAWRWYRENFGVDVRIFEDSATANLMLPYTGGEPQKRHAALALNLQGGGGFEIWQYTERTPQPPKFKILAGDLGLYIAKIKSVDVEATYEYYKEKNLKISKLYTDPAGKKHFFITDPYDNTFQIVSGKGWFRMEKKLTGASYGAIIGVTNIEQSKKFYSEILGYDTVIYDEESQFEDFSELPGGEKPFRRVLLQHSKPRMGSFSRLFGPSLIELIQVKDREPRKIYKDRFWGDLGFIHLCFDISGMEKLKAKCESNGYPFTVDSFANRNGSSFDMGEAAGHFSYVEDPDGTLIEFVETHKVPVWKKIGWYINLKKKNPLKPLPNWMVKSLKFNRVKA